MHMQIDASRKIKSYRLVPYVTIGKRELGVHCECNLLTKVQCSQIGELKMWDFITQNPLKELEESPSLAKLRKKKKIGELGVVRVYIKKYDQGQASWMKIGLCSCKNLIQRNCLVCFGHKVYLVNDKAIFYNYGTKVIELIFNLENLDNTDSSLSEIFQNGNYFLISWVLVGKLSIYEIQKISFKNMTCRNFILCHATCYNFCNATSTTREL